VGFTGIEQHREHTSIPGEGPGLRIVATWGSRGCGHNGPDLLDRGTTHSTP
jgi:hypothetical protein